MFTFTDPAPANKDLLPAMMQQYERGLEKYLGGLWRFITSPLLSYTLCVCMLCMQACVWHGVHNYNMHASRIVYLCVSADICCVPKHGQPSATTCVHISVCVWGGGCLGWLGGLVKARLWVRGNSGRYIKHLAGSFGLQAYLLMSCGCGVACLATCLATVRGCCQWWTGCCLWVTAQQTGQARRKSAVHHQKLA
jgi:hypothetical protein